MTVINTLLRRIAHTESGCILYMGPLNYKGYGKARFTRGGKKEFAHRAMYRWVHGHLPSVVMHTCDVRACINPEHLKAGSNRDNVDDKVSKSRQHMKMTDTAIEALLELKSWYRQTELSKIFAISPARVSQIVRNNGRRIKSQHCN